MAFITTSKAITPTTRTLTPTNITPKTLTPTSRATMPTTTTSKTLKPTTINLLLTVVIQIVLFFFTSKRSWTYTRSNGTLSKGTLSKLLARPTVGTAACDAVVAKIATRSSCQM